MLGVAPAVGVFRVLLLDMGAVQQNDLGKVGGRRCRKYVVAEALLDQLGQVAAVVEVRVGQDDAVDRRRIDRERLPVPLAPAP